MLTRTPLSYVFGQSQNADAIAGLLHGLTIASILVTVAVIGTVIVGTILRASPQASPADVPVHVGSSGLTWITLGLAITLIILLGALVWTLAVLSKTMSATPPALTIELTGQQWWWNARYLNVAPDRTLRVANEIHVPVGVPVLFKLSAGDVIHSFWVPALAGKTDLIPGQTNEARIKASKPGRYLGQCAEFCGLQHAHMQLVIIADMPDDYAAWYEHQLEPGAPVADPAAMRGELLFEYHCGACHTVRGTGAGGVVAPDLTHLMTRGTIAAGTLANSVINLSAWVADPQGIKPGNHMPVMGLSGPELNDVRAFLATLQ